jgi:hypothetical protein
VVFPVPGLVLTGLRTIARNCASGTTLEIDIGSSTMTLWVISVGAVDERIK